jgi:hypothetical protein
MRAGWGPAVRGVTSRESKMSDTPSNNPIRQGLELLVSGGGYNFYNQDNLARADDLLVRQQASSSLGQAATALKALEAEYTRRFIPPSTRENPYPPREAMEKRRGLTRLRERIGSLESDIRGMAAPTQDKIWRRFRQETPLLHDLLAFDHGMLLHTTEIARAAQALTADAWQAEGAEMPLLAALQQLETVAKDRQRFLSQPW